VEDGTFVPFVKSMEEMNDRSFEGHEKTLEEIKSLFFYTLYLWTVAFVSPLVISYYNFLVFFFSSF
jgi:hypothetical protein